jgi:hypothetical protein
VRKAAVLVDYPTYPLVYSYLYFIFLGKLLHTFMNYINYIALIEYFSNWKDGVALCTYNHAAYRPLPITLHHHTISHL